LLTFLFKFSELFLSFVLINVIITDFKEILGVFCLFVNYRCKKSFGKTKFRIYFVNTLVQILNVIYNVLFPDLKLLNFLVEVYFQFVN